MCVTHVYSYFELVHAIDLIDLIDLFTTLRTQFSGTICPILMKLIHVIEKGYVELICQFSSNLNFDKNVGNLSFKGIDVLYGLVGV